MAIPTSRTKEPGTVAIDLEKCDGCGLCVKVCGDNTLVMSDGKAAISSTPVFGCIGCGHCMAICPHDAIRVTGRTLSPDDLFRLPDSGEAADYNQLLNLLKRRRLREKYGIRYTSREGLLVIFGYPAVRYRKGIRRSFASVTTYASKLSKNST